ncbi:hypothetical protein ACOMHN_046458 [Nucella lapillus]
MRWPVVIGLRCKDKLNTLAISVMNQWPGVKLRVTEAWDEDSMHAENSLHYEGRAVDITTSDRDKAKYGMLARLAVEAGFDWVYYESRGHIHCSVKSDSSVAIKIGGCFPGTSDVITRGGVTRAMSDVKVGDEVLSVDWEGRLTYSEVIAFLDRDSQQRGYFYTLRTEHGQATTLTAKHLIYVVTHSNVTGYDVKAPAMTQWKTRFAEEVREGDVILLASSLGGGGGGMGVSMSRVTHVQARVQTGVYAPLTATGTVVVDGAVASCYAVLNNPRLAHAVLAPLRGWHRVSSLLSRLAPFSSSVQAHSIPPDGVHVYAKLLYDLGSFLLSPDVLYVP